MSQNKGSGSTPPPPESSTSGAQVVSLCAHRRRRSIEDATTALVRHMTLIHHRAIQVHNAVIERAGVSVLTELCRTAGLFLDLVEDDLRAAVLIPAALYGETDGDVFGKKPLQQRIEDDLEDSEAAQLLERINRTRTSVWNCTSAPEEPSLRVEPLAGPGSDEIDEVAGIIGRAGALCDVDGIYIGRRVPFRDHHFVVFAHPLDRRREVAVRDLLSSRQDRREAGIWSSVEMELVRAVVDPDDHHQWPGGEAEKKAGEGSRRPTSRNGVLLAIRRAVWRHFADADDGLTMHAHIAALIDDEEGFAALVDEIESQIDTILIKSGGLRQGALPVDVDEILAPFNADSRGRLEIRPELKEHPVGLFLLEPSTLEAAGLECDSPIAEALEVAEEHPDKEVARAIELAWMTYRTEQNLMATYGVRFGEDMAAGGRRDELSFARRSSVLPNMRTLFDPRFVDIKLADLELSAGARSRLASGLADADVDFETYTLGDIERDERELTRLWGIGHETCNAVRAALLDMGTRWRRMFFP